MVINFLRRLYRIGWALLLWALLLVVMVVQVQTNQTNLEVGKVSQRDTRAPERISYTSEIRTQRERERVASAIAPIYTAPDRSQAIQQTSTVLTMQSFLDAVRADPFGDEARKRRYIAALQPLQFAPGTVALILSLPDEGWQAVVSETLRVVDTTMRSEIREGQIASVLNRLPNQISVSLTEEQAQIVTEWAGGLVVPNSLIDNERTEAARQEARNAIAPIPVTYEPEQIVIREGEVVTPEHIEAVEFLGLQQPARPLGEMVATGLFLMLLVTVVLLYLSRIHPEHWNNPRVMALLVALLVALVIGARILMPGHVLLSYLYPTAAVAMLLGVLLGVDVALLVTVVLSLIVGFLTGSIELVTYTFVGGAVASLALWRVENLGVFVWAGVLVGLTNAVTVLTFVLLKGSHNWVDLAVLSGMGMLNGAISASLTLVGFYVLSSFLGITTFLQLMELARPTHPLFRELLLQAPGTYHHSIIVSNLAERAAEAVGADMLLLRVGAYYHDIGKMKNAHYFVENQADGVNLHDALDNPYQSAEIIVDHVLEGLRLAKKYKLPRRIIDFIAEHHGTTSVAWFYHKACQQDGEENVEEADFSYPGPAPQTREAAILMLADTVEATARAVKPGSEEEVDALVRKSITTKLSHGQLDECDLNLRDMERIRQSFVEVLQGIYHPRIAYPEGRQPTTLRGGSAALPHPTSNHGRVHEDKDERAEPDPTPGRPSVGTAG